MLGMLKTFINTFNNLFFNQKDLNGGCSFSCLSIISIRLPWLNAVRFYI